MYLLNLTTCPATTCYLQQSCITQEQPISGLCSLKISPSCCWLSSSILVSYQNTKHTVCGSPARATDSRGKKKFRGRGTRFWGVSKGETIGTCIRLYGRVLLPLARCLGPGYAPQREKSPQTPTLSYVPYSMSFLRPALA
jgi:hypothetical protein